MQSPVPESRPVKFLLTPELADRVDRAVEAGLAGFHDRHRLAAAALDAYLLELEHPPQTGEAGGPGAHSPGTADTLTLVPQVVVASERGVATLDTASELKGGPMFGLHNRDWPSLWALGRLSHAAGSAPVAVSDFITAVTAEAWELAASLGEIDPKLTALLPTNRAKSQSAEEGFRSFAIASIAKRPGESGLLSVSGPLPLWRCIAFTRSDNQLLVGLTDAGWDLLISMDGLRADQPHDTPVAERFLNFLSQNSPEDWWGFTTLLMACGDGPNRAQLVSRFAADHPEWSESVAATTAQGYVARGREWGLVAPKMDAGRYRLTEFGSDLSGRQQAS
ncbi:MAG: hypothetical protein ACYDHU_09750 [Acidimicrobiales bacterium]